jgi:hypothetical protein
MLSDSVTSKAVQLLWNIVFTPEHRFPGEEPEQFASMAAELVALRVDVLVALSSLLARAAAHAHYLVNGRVTESKKQR